MAHVQLCGPRFQKLENQEKEQEHWTRLRRYSVLLQKENVKK